MRSARAHANDVEPLTALLSDAKIQSKIAIRPPLSLQEAKQNRLH
ncbi:hypothetical protein CZ787_16215 [Halomonas citrativorans]|uniref:Uncharacterized protein n=1 Tax=Halomonas citrativorans TaxID=2742612 RepID=A0A1R4I4B2_9GAMM|nr:hypothetical protein CZ787_16215 [Halomonas citrativorans]